MGLAPLFASVRFDPKRHEDVSHSKCFAKSSKTSFLLAFIRVFRGLNFGCGGAALGNPWFFQDFEAIIASLGQNSGFSASYPVSPGEKLVVPNRRLTENHISGNLALDENHS